MLGYFFIFIVAQFSYIGCFYFVAPNKICSFPPKSNNMEKDLFRTIIAENQEYIGSIPLVQRPLKLEKYGNYVFVRVRQAGKS